MAGHRLDYLIKNIVFQVFMCVFAPSYDHVRTLSTPPFCFHGILHFDKISYSANNSQIHRKQRFKLAKNIKSDVFPILSENDWYSE